MTDFLQLLVFGLTAGAVVALSAAGFTLTFAVSLLSGIWQGDAWSAHVLDVVALVATFLICTAVSAKVFRWE